MDDQPEKKRKVIGKFNSTYVYAWFKNHELRNIWIIPSLVCLCWSYVWFDAFFMLHLMIDLKWNEIVACIKKVFQQWIFNENWLWYDWLTNELINSQIENTIWESYN